MLADNIITHNTVPQATFTLVMPPMLCSFRNKNCICPREIFMSLPKEHTKNFHSSSSPPPLPPAAASFSPLELTHWKRPWCWERLKPGEEHNRGWDSWVASLTQWTWVWVNSRSWWWTQKPGMLQSVESQRVRHGWVTELKACNCLDVFYPSTVFWF